ncbi:MAG: hypothetical protein JNK58_05655, partial [Phycisphaerae bacterium]|nr:hypothetical protein [Phycisphaerae bacterium]
MTGIAAYLDALSEPDARAALLRCCASSDWVNRMIQTRPFLHDTRLFAAADRAWNALKPADWLEAFAAHPRIGDRP